MNTVPIEVLLRDDQTSITEISDSYFATPKGSVADRRALSVAVAAALHAAVSASQENKAHAIDGKAIKKNNTSTSRAKAYLSLLSSADRLEGSSVTLQRNNRTDDSLMSPMTGDISQNSTLEHAQKVRSYSDLEDRRLNIQGDSESHKYHTPTSAIGIVGILKHGHHSGIHRKTPSQSSSKLSGQAQSNQKPDQIEQDALIRLLSERMNGGHEVGVSTSMHGLSRDYGSLPRRQSSSVHHLSQHLETYCKPISSMPAHSSRQDDHQADDLEFEC